MLLFFIALSFSLCLSISKTFHFNLSNYIYFAITKSFSLLRLLFTISLSSSVILFSLCVASLQYFLRYLISCSCYQLFQLFFFIFLTLLCSFVFFSILSGLLILKLDFHCSRRCIYCISYFWLGVLISYVVCHDSVGTLFYFFT